MLLQVMEEGRLTDSFGRNVDFRNTILIMTTNACAEAIKNESAFGFQAPDTDASYDSMKGRVNERIERVFRPEFLESSRRRDRVPPSHRRRPARR